MKVNIATGKDQNQPHRLYLLPESDRDRRTLERLAAEYYCTNFGRDAETGDVLHVAVEIKATEQD